MTADVWFGCIVVGLTLYVALDGGDLGIGILAIGQSDDADRRSLLEAVARVWDGNESWILLVAVGTWAGFPAVTGALLPAVYPALIIMLFSFIARGVSIEMISNSPGWPRWWGWAFMTGSTVAAFAQGTVIGTVVQGVRVGAANRFSGGTFDFLSGYSVLAGVTTVVLYALAGAAMAKLRADDDRLKTIVARWGRRLVPVAASLVVLSGALLSVAGASTLVIDQPLRITLLSGACFTAACMFATTCPLSLSSGPRWPE